MTNIVAKAQQAVMGSQGDKSNDLAKETKEISDKDRLTTDYGVKQSTADDWLRVVSQDKQGPTLLEDPFARERVCPINVNSTFVVTLTLHHPDHEV